MMLGLWIGGCSLYTKWRCVYFLGFTLEVFKLLNVCGTFYLVPLRLGVAA